MSIALVLLLACGSTADRTPAPATTAPATSAHAPDAPATDAATDPAATTAPPAQAQPRDMDIAALTAKKASGDYFVLDVRTAREFAEGHVPGAVNIPIQELGARLSELQPQKDADFAVICASGGRSARATDSLRAEGFAGATNVEGGTQAWIAAGHPTE